MPQQQTPFLSALNILMIFLLFFLTRPTLKNGQLSQSRRLLVSILVVVFCLFSFWGKDWFGYLNYYTLVKDDGINIPLEDVYLWVIDNLCPNYIVFRIWVWGLAFLLFWRTLSRVDINKDLALFFFCSIYLIWFSYARVSLCMACLFYGLSLFSADNKNSRLFPHKLLAVVLIAASFYLHKSAVFGIVIVLAVLVLKSSGKTAMIASIVAFPIIVLIVSRFLSGFMEELVENETDIINEYASQGKRYLESSDRLHGPGAILQRVFERMPYYLISLACIKAQFDTSIKIPNGVRSFMLAAVLLTFGSSVFLFNLGMNTDIVYTRFLRFTFIPACISLTYLKQTGLYPKWIKATYLFAIIGCVYVLVYSFYNVWTGYYG